MVNVQGVIVGEWVCPGMRGGDRKTLVSDTSGQEILNSCCWTKPPPQRTRIEWRGRDECCGQNRNANTMQKAVGYRVPFRRLLVRCIVEWRSRERDGINYPFYWRTIDANAILWICCWKWCYFWLSQTKRSQWPISSAYYRPLYYEIRTWEPSAGVLIMREVETCPPPWMEQRRRP